MNVTFNWTLPTKRTDGKDLTPAEIASVEVTFGIAGLPATSLGKFPPSVLTTSLQDVEAGDYIASAFVTDTQSPAEVSNGVSIPVSIAAPHLAAPGDVSLAFTIA